MRVETIRLMTTSEEAYNMALKLCNTVHEAKTQEETIAMTIAFVTTRTKDIAQQDNYWEILKDVLSVAVYATTAWEDSADEIIAYSTTLYTALIKALEERHGILRYT